MSQYNFSDIDPDLTSGTALATLLNSWREAIKTNHSGASRPSYAVANMIWVKTVSATAHEVYYYDGTDDILLYTVNPTANTVSPAITGGMQVTGTSAFGTLAWPTTILGKSSDRVLIGNEGALALWNENNAVGAYCSLYLGAKHNSVATAIAGGLIRGGTESTNYSGFLSFLTQNAAGTYVEAYRVNSTQDMIIGGTSKVASAKLSLPSSGAYAGFGATYQMLIGEDVPNSAGFFGTLTNHDVIFRANNTPRLLLEAGGVFRPAADNSQTLGSASYRWSTVYAGTGTINTSDGRAKQDVRALTGAEIAAARALAAEVGTYRFIAAVAAKGAAARQHAGLTVQRAIEVMEAHGLDPLAYGFICYDAWPERTIEHPAQTHEEPTGLLDAQGNPALRTVIDAAAWTETIPAGDTYGFRTDELLLFIARGLAAGQADLEARIAALEAA